MQAEVEQAAPFAARYAGITYRRAGPSDCTCAINEDHGRR